ncbi:VWA domain-containing protein [Mycoplasma sp. CSL10166]|uniref:VWA domain-containing protein n=1 Tax=Mycoplasma sp. CSL10166 TaxID=2813825 RepID=UPI00197BD2BC|nr:VWA domain-containing protein [Mycoplasma sp. CSL10166]MBN4084417.1 VWA domain-containing protein [Mycoplasma sp. CSL10166]
MKKIKNNILEKIKEQKNTFLNKLKPDLDEINDESISKTIKDEIDQKFTVNNNQINQSYQIALNELELDLNNINLNNYIDVAQKLSKKIVEYKNTFQHLVKTKTKDNFDRFMNILETIIETKTIENYICNFNLTRNKWLDEFYKKIKEIARITKNIKSFLNVFGVFWDLSIHDLFKVNVNLIEKLSVLLEQNYFINEIAELLGKLAESEKEYEKQEIQKMTKLPSNKKWEYSPSNYVGIKTGNDLFSILAHQFGYRNNKDAALLFNKLFTEKQLIMFDKRERVVEEKYISSLEEREKNIDKKGPFILVIDTSGSMHGTPENIAKAFALAITKIAHKQSRKCYIINFSNGIIEYDATDLAKNWNKFYEFLSMSFGGGTDIEPAIESSIKTLEKEDFKNSDVLFISDMIINQLKQEIINKIKLNQEKKVRFHSLTIGNSFKNEFINFLDNNWVYDGSKESINNIINSLNKLKEND